MISASNVYDIDAVSEPILIEQGKEVTQNSNEAHFIVYITNEYKIADPIFGSFRYDKTLNMAVKRNYDGVTVLRKTIRGGATEGNKRKLLHSLKNKTFTCTNQ